MVEKTAGTLEKIITIVSQHLGIEAGTINGESRFVEDLGADSLDLVDLVMELEDSFEIEISDNETSKFKTVNDVVAFINTLEDK